MLESTKELMIEVADGNPGAFRVISELMWFTKWLDMMNWCADNLKGSDLWVKYKDEFKCDAHALGNWIQEQMK